MQFILKGRFSAWTVPLALLVVCIVSFGLLIPQLGLYWDDWETILVIRQFPLSEFWSYFSGARPLAAWTYVAFSPLLGSKPLHWHLFTLLLRWLSAVGMWWVFSSLWPQNRRPVAYAAFLFAVYPVFLQQPISVAYHQHWTAYALYFASLGCMVQAALRPAKYWLFMLLSAVGLVLHLAIFEYFVGVELLRPVILWLLAAGSEKSLRRGALKTLAGWLPYLLILLAFLSWRTIFALHASGDPVVDPTADPNPPSLLFALTSQPLAVLSRLLEMGIKDLIFILVSAWHETLLPALINLSRPFIVFSWAMAALSAAGLAFYLARLELPQQEDERRQSSWLRQALGIGLLANVLGAAPVWVTERYVAMGGTFTDRFALVSMFGASLLLAAFLEWLGRRPRQVVVVGVLAGLAVGMHLRNADGYAWSWEKQQQVAWQLFWRAPHVKENTAFLADRDLYSYVRPTFAFNLLYIQPQASRRLAYWFYLYPPDFKSGEPGWAEGKPLHEQFRQFTFDASSLDTLVVFYEPPEITNCLWVLDPDVDKNNPNLSGELLSALAVANLDRVEPTAARSDYPPSEIFGQQPAPGWCYYFQKAELARQFGDWRQVVELGDDAVRQGFLPNKSASNSPREWLPFIEAYAYSGRWEEAEEYTLTSYRIDTTYRPMLCGLWERVQTSAAASPQRDAAALRVMDEMGCLPD